MVDNHLQPEEEIPVMPFYRQGSEIGGAIGVAASRWPQARPQRGRVAVDLGVTPIEERAMMIEAFRPLDPGPGGGAGEDDRYTWSWLGGR